MTNKVCDEEKMWRDMKMKNDRWAVISKKKRKKKRSKERDGRWRSRDKGCRWLSVGWSQGGGSHILSAQLQLVA